MTDNELKKLASAKLAGYGVTISQDASFRELAYAIGKVIGKPIPWNKGLAEYVRVWTAPAQSTRYVKPFRPLRAAAHPRAADIDASQPPFITPRGAVGNGNENSQVWRR